MNKIGDYESLKNEASVSIDDPKQKELYDAIQKAVKDFDPNAEQQDENLEFKETDAVGVGEMFSRFADGCDKTLMYIGFFWSALFGASTPAFCVVFGELINDLGE